MTDSNVYDVLNELRVFIAGATRSVKCNELDLARTALNLLKTLPASRDAVLEYFCSVFDSSVKKYAIQAQNDNLMNAPAPLSHQEEAVIAEIHSVLCNFVTANPDAWAPIISAWSLQVLGEVSSHYNHLPSSVGLNEALHWWMSCKAARTLVDITTQCLSCLIDTDSEACIDALLDTSVAHSPHFDWVVAHVGSCFPKTVITKVLSCGLKDFCAKGSITSASKSAKINSVVGILGHLASSHFVSIRSALLELFKWNLQQGSDNSVERHAVVPYLLQLASKSQMLLRALSTDVLHTLNMDMLCSLAEMAHSWHPYFRDDPECLEDLVVHLALRCEQGGAKVLSLLLDGGSYPQPTVSVTCHVLLELLLEDIDVQLRSYKNTSIPFLDSIKSELCQVQPLLLSNDALKQKTACRLLRLMGGSNLSVVVESSCYLLLRGTTHSHMAALTQLLGAEGSAGDDRNVLGLALEQALRNVTNQCIDKTHDSVDAMLLWANISTLLRYKEDVDGVSFCKAVRQNLGPLSDMLASSYDPESLHSVASVLELLPTASVTALPLQLTLRITKNCVKYVFVCIAERDRCAQTVCCRRACLLLSRFSSSSVARSLALRELLKTSLFLSASTLFGAPRRVVRSQIADKYLLMEENLKLGTATTMVSQRQSTAFGTGTFVLGPKPRDGEDFLNKDFVKRNTLRLMEAIRACCVDARSDPNPVSLGPVIQVALLMVELISPDVMYNGLPWPDDEFCKVTVERNVQIRKTFDDLPLAWHLLELVSLNEPALCYCSILLRALMDTLLSQWGSAAASGNPSVLRTTVRLLRIMAVGQLLPPPLSSLHDVIGLLSPHEVVLLLRDCVWCYMRDNVPSPALFSRDPRTGFMWRDPALSRPSPQYTESLRLVLQDNIRHFGPLYSKLFVHS